MGYAGIIRGKHHKVFYIDLNAALVLCENSMCFHFDYTAIAYDCF